MAEAVLSVCWKDHTNELATGYKSLLENNFLVDCTISAEGQSIKAHRLLLSACSPYFHMLFREETGKHPFIILLDAPFEALKAVIDFVYQGETQIPEGNLRAFLTLAQSLQIKGLNAFSKRYESKNISSNTAGNISQGAFEDNQDTCEVQSISADELDPENYSQQNPHHSDGYPEAVNTNSSVSFEDYSGSCENVRAPQEYQKPDEVLVDSGITMKHEPLFAEFCETRTEILNSAKSNKPMCRNFVRELDRGTASIFGEGNMKQNSGCSGPTHGNDSSVMPRSQHSSEKGSSGRDVDKDEPILPVILVPKSECMDDEWSEEPMDDPDMPGNYTNDTDEGTEPSRDKQNFDHSLRAHYQQSEMDLTTQQGSTTRLCSRVSQENNCLTSQSELQQPKSRRQDSEGVPNLINEGWKAFPSSSHLRSHKRMGTADRSVCCDVCGKDFTDSGVLVRHKRIHTGERPYSCVLCRKAFGDPTSLTRHKRVHTGERPYPCDVCGKAFTDSANLSRHKRLHTGERPYRCDVCGKDFTNKSSLSHHMPKHLVGQL